MFSNFCDSSHTTFYNSRFSGIGLGIAEHFAQTGSDVVLNGFGNAEAIDRIVKVGNFMKALITILSVFPYFESNLHLFILKSGCKDTRNQK